MPIDPLPTPPSTGDPEIFDSRADAFLGALPDFQSQANALESNVETLEGNATTAAQSASDDADATAADRVQTGEDRGATAADRVQTGNDRDAVDAKYTEFDARWLGSKSADPTTDNEGEPLIDGAAYFNTESDPPQIRQYDLATDTWVVPAFPSKASESQAETGTDDTAYMTALKSKQANDFQIPEQTQTVWNTGTDTTESRISSEKLDAKIKTLAIGEGQSRQDVTASRSQNTTYTNSTGRAIIVRVESTDTDVRTEIQWTIDGQNYPGTECNFDFNARLVDEVLIMAGETYEVNIDGAGLSSWWEIR